MLLVIGIIILIIVIFLPSPLVYWLYARPWVLSHEINWYLWWIIWIVWGVIGGRSTSKIEDPQWWYPIAYLVIGIPYAVMNTYIAYWLFAKAFPTMNFGGVA